MADLGRPILIFDGDCGFCTASADWLAAGWRDGVDLAAWQRLGPARLQEIGVSPEQCREAAFWVEPPDRVFEGHRAIGKAMSFGTGWRRVAGRIILSPVVDPVARSVYRIVARYRYRLPGGTAACRIPTD